MLRKNVVIPLIIGFLLNGHLYAQVPDSAVILLFSSTPFMKNHEIRDENGLLIATAPVRGLLEYKVAPGKDVLTEKRFFKDRQKLNVQAGDTLYLDCSERNVLTIMYRPFLKVYDQHNQQRLFRKEWFVYQQWQAKQNDTLLVVSDYARFEDTSCYLRNSLRTALIEQDLSNVEQLLQTSLLFQPDENDDYVEQDWSIVSWPEKTLLDFVLGNYSELLENVQRKQDFFTDMSVDYLPYGCPDGVNLTFRMVDYWRSQNETVLRKITDSGLTEEQTRLLSGYWKSVLIYLEAGESFPPELNRLGEQFEADFPGSSYTNFASRRMTLASKRYFINGIGLSAGVGFTAANGPLSNYLEIGMTREISGTFKKGRSAFSIGIANTQFDLKQSFARIDSIDVPAYTEVKLAQINIGYNYDLIAGEAFQLSVLAGIAGATNISVPRESALKGDTLRYGSENHVTFRGGLSGRLLLVPTLFGRNNAMYYHDLLEERVRQVFPLYLTFKAVYQPAVFYGATDVRGGLTTITVGLEFLIGLRAPDYRKNRAFRFSRKPAYL